MTAAKQEATLEEQRKYWLEVLSGEDTHSIVRQLTRMTWNAAAYQVVNEARRLAPPDSEGGVQLNGMVHRLIDHGFFTSHVAAVRRLMDTYCLEGGRGVYSLSGLLKDMKAHRELLTREAIFRVEGRPYDYEPVRQKFWEYAHHRKEAGERAYHVPRELWWKDHKRRHESIDRLSGVCSDSRKPGDMVRDEVFNNLWTKADRACRQVITHVTQFVAHAGNPESRVNVQADDAGITLDNLWKAHRSLCEIASFIAVVILGGSCPGFLPTPQFNQFRHIEKGLVAPSDLPTLKELWQGFDREYHDWSQWTLEDYEREFHHTLER